MDFSTVKPLSFYDTFTRKKVPFVPLDESNIRLYVCGPTVYDYAHIGNARPVVVFDVLYRLFYLPNVSKREKRAVNVSNSHPKKTAYQPDFIQNSYSYLFVYLANSFNWHHAYFHQRIRRYYCWKLLGYAK